MRGDNGDSFSCSVVTLLVTSLQLFGGLRGKMGAPEDFIELGERERFKVNIGLWGESIWEIRERLREFTVPFVELPLPPKDPLPSLLFVLAKPDPTLLLELLLLVWELDDESPSPSSLPSDRGDGNWYGVSSATLFDNFFWLFIQSSFVGVLDKIFENGRLAGDGLGVAKGCGELNPPCCIINRVAPKGRCEISVNSCSVSISSGSQTAVTCYK